VAVGSRFFYVLFPECFPPHFPAARPEAREEIDSLVFRHQGRKSPLNPAASADLKTTDLLSSGFRNSIILGFSRAS